MNPWTRAGIQAYRAGNPQQARRFFKLAEMESPTELLAWLWSVEVAESDAEKQRCLEQIVALDPGQVAAWTALAALQTRHRPDGRPHVSPFITQEPDPAAPDSASQEAPANPFTDEPPPNDPAVPDAAPTLSKKIAAMLKGPWKVL
jgi:hypothetical protein